jgi:undecaprenyl phosphate-alpha-L-ara4N flippase subunit ArnF
MSTLFWLAVATLLTVIGDYLLKLAASGAGLASWHFVLGALCYGSPALAWYVLMQQHNLATVAVLYSVATLIFVAGLGVVVFKEPFTWREAAGVSLALAAVLVMNVGREA